MAQAHTTVFYLPAAYSSLETLSERLRLILETINDLCDREITQYNILLAADEIFTNIVRHAYAGRTDGQVATTVLFNAMSRDFMVEFRDTGRPFDISCVSPPDLEQVHEGGYGLFLARHLMDNVVYRAQAEGNRWTLMKQV